MTVEERVQLELKKLKACKIVDKNKKSYEEVEE